MAGKFTTHIGTVSIGIQLRVCVLANKPEFIVNGFANLYKIFLLSSYFIVRIGS
jgi:hypothetical protein